VELSQQLFLGFLMIWVMDNTVYRTNLNALWSIIMSHTLGAQGGFNYIGFITLRNGAIRALWFAYVAVDALVGN